MKLFLFTIFVILIIKTHSARVAQPRIRNGYEVTNIENFKYQVGIRIFDKAGQPSWCGGSLLSNQWVLTAAHCLQNKDRVILYFGIVNRYQPEQGSIVLNVNNKDFIIHNFEMVLKQNDLALIKLTTPITFNNRIQPINLAPNAYSNISYFDNKDVFISGWGLASNDRNNLIGKLQFAKVKVLEEETCKKYFSEGKITSLHICTVGTGETGFCQGDSGGPLVIYMDGTRYQIGIVSFMLTGNCENQWPRVYTRITKYLPWICEKTGICQKTN